MITTKIYKEATIVEKEHKVYVTSDSKEFEKDYDAKAHERKLAIKSIQTRKDLVFWEGYIPYGENFDNDNYNYCWYKVETPEALEAISEAYTLYHKNYPNYINFKHDLKLELINKWFCVEEDSETEIYLYTLDNTIKEFTEFISKLGYEIEIKEKPKTEE